MLCRRHVSPVMYASMGCTGTAISEAFATAALILTLGPAYIAGCLLEPLPESIDMSHEVSSHSNPFLVHLWGSGCHHHKHTQKDEVAIAIKPS